MRLSAGRPLSLTLLLLAGTAPGLQAQSSPAPASGAAGIYTCIDDQGRRITADRPIPSCTAKEQRVLNKDGSLKAVYPPILTVEERAQKEAAERKAAEARATHADAVRRDRNLLARYPNEAPHRKAREAALDTVRVAIKASEKRLQDLAAERKPLLAEAEFYVGKPLPPKLRNQLDANDAATVGAARGGGQPGSRTGTRDPLLRRRTGAAEAAVGRRGAGLAGADRGAGHTSSASSASNLKASTLR